MVPREQEQLKMVELMKVGRFERKVLGEETALESTVHLVLSTSDVIDTMTRSNLFHLEAIVLGTGVLFQAQCLFIGLVEMFRRTEEKSSLSFVIRYSLM